jgi:DNA repair exonuclease SbcCD ATPase subunit
MADLVSEIISQGALDQLELANAQLELAVKNVNNVATAAKGIVIDFKGAGNIGELNAAMAKQAENIQTITEATKKYEAAVDKKQRAIEIAERNELLGIQKVIAEREKAAKQADLDAETVRKNAEREEKALAKLNNAYEQLKVQYKKAADEAKKLGAEFGVTDARATAAAGSAMKLYNSLLAVEKSVGQAQRQVGQYNTAAVAMSQILREMPAFTYSAATGFLAMSNNIPILVDEIAKLKTANDALKASGGTAIPIWKTLMSSITSPVGLITIATTAITFLAAKTDIFKSSVDEAGKAVEDLSQKLQDIRQDMMDAFSTENTDISTLVSILEDTNNLLNLRIAALKELQKLKPQYFNELSAEQDLKGVEKDKLETLKQQILVEKELEATGKRIKTLTEERARLEKQKAVESQKGENISYILGFGQNKASDIGDINLQIAAVTEQIESAQKALASFRKISLTFPTAPEKGKEPKAKKEKAAKDTTAKSESDLLRTEYELNKQRTEQNAAMLKEIADNEKNTLNQRLDAYMEYQSELFQAAVLERDYIVKQEQAKQAEIREKLKTAKGQEIENLNDQLIASNLRITMAAEKTAGEFIDIEKKQAEGRLSIIESANEKFIDAQKELLTKLTTGELALYSQEIENLKIALDTKEITRRQYNKRLAEVQKKQQIAFLQAEIEFDEKVLANLSLTAEKRKQFEEKLAKDKEAKLKAEKGVATPRKGGSRITDSVAKLFVPEDMENEEQYLQEFYDRTVELANQAANAIIEAKNRQFEAENARLDEQARKIEANYTEQSRLINATVKDETERYNQQQKLLAQTEAQQSGIEDRKREVAKRQAAAQKAASVAAIIQNTAVAIAAALKYTVGAAPIIALIAASGAVQLAAALNTPIPAYKEGTTYHKGGKFIAGDGGEKELIIAPNKTPYWSNSISTLYDEAEGTKVIPKSAMQYAMANTTSNVGNLSAAYDARNSAIIAETIGSIVSREFDKTGRKLATVIVNSQPKQHQTESVADELRKMRNLQGL